MSIVLSYVHAASLVQAMQHGASSVFVSLDLGMTQVEAALLPQHVVLPDHQILTWQMIDEILNTPNGCFVLEGDALRKIQAFSDETGLVCSLMPTQGVPTLLLGGFPMHRIKGIDPQQDTKHKIQAIRPIVGRVLDTTTGLGYTAIHASHTASEVITVEIDPTVLEIARQNPWSSDLFDNPKITQLVGDSCEVITEFPNRFFDRVIHDPPTFSLAGDLYSQTFYRDLFRVLSHKGRLFHYIGDPDSGLGKRVAKGVVQRLKDVGFKAVRPFPRAFGVVAFR